MQANTEASARRLKAVEKSVTQREQARYNKIQALKDANNTGTQNQGGGKKRSCTNTWSGNSKGNKGWKQHQGYSKSSVNLEPNHKFHKAMEKVKARAKANTSIDKSQPRCTLRVYGLVVTSLALRL